MPWNRGVFIQNDGIIITGKLWRTGIM